MSNRKIRVTLSPSMLRAAELRGVPISLWVMQALWRKAADDLVEARTILEAAHFADKNERLRREAAKREKYARIGIVPSPEPQPSHSGHALQDNHPPRNHNQMPPPADWLDDKNVEKIKAKGLAIAPLQSPEPASKIIDRMRHQRDAARHKFGGNGVKMECNCGAKAGELHASFCWLAVPGDATT